MATKIRLARGGSNKRPFYRIVVTDSRSPRDGRFIEKLGTYNPLLSKDNDNRVQFDVERVKYWLGVGATPSDRVESFFVAAKLMERDKNKQATLDARIAKSQADKKAKEEEAKKKAEEEAKKKAEEEAAAKAEAEAAAKEAAAEDKPEEAAAE